MNNEDDEPVCRFCFDVAEPNDPLLTPCLCKGDQKYVHQSCLHKWQRSVLVSQPTHPAFYQRDVRQEICNVCKGVFDPPPPPRAELMAGFTGAELAGLLREGVLIVTEPRTSRQMARTMRTMRGAGSLRHWVKGIYLITEVKNSSATDGGDRITAVNLTRRIKPDELPPQLLRLGEKLAEEATLPSRDGDGEEMTDAAPSAADAPVDAVAIGLEHYIGGPCLTFRPTGVALLREAGHPRVSAALEAATGGVALGPTPGQQGSVGGSAADAAQDGWEDGGRWVSGDLSTVCALVRHEVGRRGGTSGSVRVVWGDARWSRAQLLGELARGHWGMCSAAVHDVFATESGPAQWEALVACENERIVYAPRSEMTEEVGEEEEEDGEEGGDGHGGEEDDDEDDDAEEEEEAEEDAESAEERQPQPEEEATADPDGPVRA